MVLRAKTWNSESGYCSSRNAEVYLILGNLPLNRYVYVSDWNFKAEVYKTAKGLGGLEQNTQKHDCHAIGCRRKYY